MLEYYVYYVVLKRNDTYIPFRKGIALSLLPKKKKKGSPQKLLFSMNQLTASNVIGSDKLVHPATLIPASWNLGG